ncbi:MAG: ribonuclease HII [Victivallales bacterium]|nr:ribonuclease HII [Victivallales bacterium]
MDFLSGNDELLSLERQKRAEGFSVVAGVDEVGRGPLAGPVVAAAVAFPPAAVVPAVNDSKLLSAGKRDRLDAMIRAVPGVKYGIATVEAAEIDRINILEAARLAMRLAVQQLGPIDFLLIDGWPVAGFAMPTQALIKGDRKSASIAAASILAKVHRDRLMEKLALKYPGYGFEHHKGYGTKEHLAALARLGVCPLHRRSFAPVRDAITPPPQQLELF